VTVVVGQVQLAGLVLAERRDPVAGREQLLRGPDAAVAGQPPEASRAEVAVVVDAAVRVAAGHGAAEVVVVLGDGIDQPAGVAVARRVEAARAFLEAPAVVLAAGARGRLEIDLLGLVLADVADVEVAGRAVEGDLPRVAQAVSPDLTPPAQAGVARRDAVRLLARLDVDPQHLAEQVVQVLGAVLLVAGTAAVAGAYVEVAVTRAEVHDPAVVVPGQVRHRQDDRLGARERVARHDVRVVGAPRVVHVVVALGGEPGRERDAQQALLVAAALDLAAYVEQRPGDRAVLDDSDPASALDHEEAARPVAGVGYVDRLAEPRGHLEQRHARPVDRRARRQDHDEGADEQREQQKGAQRGRAVQAACQARAWRAV
jgi:hypothetical protein